AARAPRRYPPPLRRCDVTAAAAGTGFPPPPERPVRRSGSAAWGHRRVRAGGRRRRDSRGHPSAFGINVGRDMDQPGCGAPRLIHIPSHIKYSHLEVELDAFEAVDGDPRDLALDPREG